MDLDPGELDQLVYFETSTGTQDGYGHETKNWVPYATEWAKVRGLGGREFFAAMQTGQEHTIEVIVRARPDLDLTMRLVWNGKPYDLTGVTAFGYRQSWLRFMALNGVKDGR